MGIFQFDHAPEGVKVRVGTGSSLAGFHQSSRRFVFFSSSPLHFLFSVFNAMQRFTHRRLVLEENAAVARFVASVKAMAAAVDAVKIHQQIRHPAAIIYLNLSSFSSRVLPCNGRLPASQRAALSAVLLI